MRSHAFGRQTKAFAAAFPHTVPVLLGFFVLGAAFGMLMQSSGFSPMWALFMSAVAFGGSVQFAAIPLLLSPFDPIGAFLLSLMVNARHLFYGLSMLEKYSSLGLRRLFLIFGLCDETFSIVSSAEIPDDVEPGDFYLAVTFLDYFYWTFASFLGAAAGSLILFDTTGMDFALTALFVVLFLEQMKKKENRVFGWIGAGCALAARLLFGADGMVLPAMAAILAVLLLGRRRLCK